MSAKRTAAAPTQQPLPAARRALADRVIYDVAVLLYITNGLDAPDLEKRATSRPTVREALARAAGALSSAGPDGQPAPPGGANVPDLAAALVSARDAVLALVLAPAAPAPGVPDLASAALDLAEALPDLTIDPIVLHWALHPDYRDAPTLARRQAALLAEARRRLQNQK